MSALIPIDPERVQPEQQANWSIVYHYTRSDGRVIDLPASDVFHLRGLSYDGILGLSRTKLAREAIGLALQAETAAARLFSNGMMVGVR